MSVNNSKAAYSQMVGDVNMASVLLGLDLESSGHLFLLLNFFLNMNFHY